MIDLCFPSFKLVYPRQNFLCSFWLNHQLLILHVFATSIPTSTWSFHLAPDSIRTSRTSSTLPGTVSGAVFRRKSGDDRMSGDEIGGYGSTLSTTNGWVNTNTNMEEFCRLIDIQIFAHSQVGHLFEIFTQTTPPSGQNIYWQWHRVSIEPDGITIMVMFQLKWARTGYLKFTSMYTISPYV